MERDEALRRLSEIHQRDLVALANELNIPILGVSGKKNKGWAGHVLERHLGLPLNSSRAPNFGSWELKSTSLVVNNKGLLQPKETLAITMLDPKEVAEKSFKESHLYTKLRKMIVAVRVWEDTQETKSIYLGAFPFDLDDHEVLSTIQSDYETIRHNIINNQGLSSSLGQYIQPRTKGAGGDAPKTRAFYGRKSLISKIIDIEELNSIFAKLSKI